MSSEGSRTEPSSTFEVSWGAPHGTLRPDVTERRVGSVAELAELLEELDALARRDQPLAVEIIAPNEAVLRVSVGREWSVVTYNSAGNRPPYAGVLLYLTGFATAPLVGQLNVSLSSGNLHARRGALARGRRRAGGGVA
jgi:hypothetical protein